MAQKKQKRMTPFTPDSNLRNQEYIKRYYTALGKFRGIEGPTVETDMGPELTWEVKPDREEAVFLLLDEVWNMIFDLHERLDRIEKEGRI